jgi:hypothetical protein
VISGNSTLKICTYKNVLAKINDLRYQGFNWLGRYFVELKQIFGSAASVQNFDIVSNTLKCMCASSCNLPSRWIHCQLDDIPFVCAPNVPWGCEFAEKYKKICCCVEHVHTDVKTAGWAR